VPGTGRFRQLTAEDGHVLAVARSADRRRILVVTAQTLIRGDKPGLDGVAVRELTLTTMSASPPVSVPGPLADLSVQLTAHGFVLEVRDGAADRSFTLSSEGTLVPARSLAKASDVAFVNASGVLPVDGQSIGGPCGVTARDRDHLGGALRLIEVKAHGRSRTIGEPFGAGLAGIPLLDDYESR